MNIKSSRRNFLKGSLATGAMLVIGLNADGVLAAGTADATLNPFVKISGDGSITVILKHFEMLQHLPPCGRAQRSFGPKREGLAGRPEPGHLEES